MRIGTFNFSLCCLLLLYCLFCCCVGYFVVVLCVGVVVGAVALGWEWCSGSKRGGVKLEGKVGCKCVVSVLLG